jgi:hypothetical protein
MKLKHKEHCNATWIEFELNSNTLKGIWIQLNSIPIRLNLIQKLF